MRSSIGSALGLTIALTLASAPESASADEVTSTTTTTTTSSTPVRPATSARVALDPGAPSREVGYVQRTLPNRPLLTSGSVLFASSYVPAVIGAAVSSRHDADHLYIPVAGPWMTLSRGSDESAGYKALLIADGAVQGLGTLMILSSLFIPERTTRDWYLIGKSDKFRVGPQRVRAGMGLAAVGRF
jgi:peptidoglycan hydrolase-like protein with peptidoglycan-binding domain